MVHITSVSVFLVFAVRPYSPRNPPKKRRLLFLFVGYGMGPSINRLFTVSQAKPPGGANWICLFRFSIATILPPEPPEEKTVPSDK
jgi:hypothetical protein